MVRALLNALPAGTKKFIWTFSAILAALSLLDILALGLLALLLAPMLAGETARIPVIGVTLRSPGDFGIALAVVCTLIITKDLLAIAVQRFSTRRFGSSTHSFSPRGRNASRETRRISCAQPTSEWPQPSQVF